MKSKLNLDPKVVDSARQHAANIAHDMQEFIERHTTVSTERTIVRLLGVDGVDDVDTPLPNVVVDQLKEAGALPTDRQDSSGDRRRNGRRKAGHYKTSYLLSGRGFRSS